MRTFLFLPLLRQRFSTPQAAQLAISRRLRGADAVYVATAQEFGTTLITWDKEMLTRGANVVAVMTPTDWLAANPV